MDATEQDEREEMTPREQAQWLHTWLRSHWGEFGTTFETCLCNAAAAPEATES